MRKQFIAEVYVPSYLTFVKNPVSMQTMIDATINSVIEFEEVKLRSYRTETYFSSDGSVTVVIFIEAIPETKLG